MFGRRVFTHTFARMILLALVVLFLWALFAKDSTASGTGQRYVVQPGDTLWSIATDRFGGDPREGVWEIKRHNDLRSSAIVPGQVLRVP